MFPRIDRNRLAAASGGSSTKTDGYDVSSWMKNEQRREQVAANEKAWAKYTAICKDPPSEAQQKSDFARTLFKNIEGLINPFFKGFQAK
jgi:hypothetical protein